MTPLDLAGAGEQVSVTYVTLSSCRLSRMQSV